MDYDELDHFTLLANKRASCSGRICYKEVSSAGMRVAAAGTESTQALVSMSRFSASGMVDEAFGGDQATEELFVATKDISALDGFDLSIILGHPGVYIGKILDEREGFTNDIHYRSLQSGKSRIHVSESSRISTSKTWLILLSP